MIIADFRANFPEFVDAAIYKDTQITFQSTFAEKITSKDAWGDCWENGVELLTAHLLVIAVANKKASVIGAIPGGTNSGATSSKQVGDTSISYDVSNSAELGAGFYNSTSYGRQYWHYLMLFGTGAIQIY